MNITDLQAMTPTWCPGCGNYGLWGALKSTIVKLGWSMDQFVIVYGVGCSGNMTDFVKSYGFHSLHGRAIPNAIGIKLANHSLKVICVVGDGDFYGEGGNHFLHAVRGNHDITVIMHDNRVYGLTTGQTAPTSPKGYKSKSTPQGVIEQPINGLGIAILQGASFVSRGFAGDVPHLQTVFEKALLHTGFALVDVLQPCVTFNKINTYQYYRERVYKLEEIGHDAGDKIGALQKSPVDQDKIALGVLYEDFRPAYHEEIAILKDTPLVKQPLVVPDLNDIMSQLI
jgi:2-oxoglutarate/2-oxoacid ferredoxin oxidoreductase subunit beta